MSKVQSYQRLDPKERQLLDLITNGPGASAPVPVQFTSMFVIYETVDDRGGRGKLVGIYEDEDEAVSVAKGKGWYGGDGDIKEVPVIVNGMGEVFILSSLAAVEPNTNLIEHEKALIDQALKKLSPADRAVLSRAGIMK